jgi:predicted metal-dependent HD superfamily phosphohydrolase
MSATLRRSWARACAAIGTRHDEALREHLLAAYAQPHRKYHTLQHLTECIATLARSPVRPARLGEIEIALWFHDAIYDLGRDDNEARSAEWAKDGLIRAGASPAVAARVHDLVLVTRHTALPQTVEAQLLVDVDLSILGASPSRFDEYERQIREEYARVPEEAYRRRRREVLEQFLARQAIYSTAHFRGTLEAPARENLRRSIAALT